MEKLQAVRDCNSFGAAKQIQGLILTMHFLGEVTMFMYSGTRAQCGTLHRRSLDLPFSIDKLIRHLGIGAATTFVLFLWCARLLLSTVLADPWMVLPLEFVGGWSTALTFSAINAFAAATAANGLQARVANFSGSQCAKFQFIAHKKVSKLYLKDKSARA